LLIDTQNKYTPTDCFFSDFAHWDIDLPSLTDKHCWTFCTRHWISFRTSPWLQYTNNATKGMLND